MEIDGLLDSRTDSARVNRAQNAFSKEHPPSKGRGHHLRQEEELSLLPPEVWVSEEILRQKLKGQNDLTGKKNLLKNPGGSQEP
jgi:hypothetical protein